MKPLLKHDYQWIYTASAAELAGSDYSVLSTVTHTEQDFRGSIKGVLTSSAFIYFSYRAVQTTYRSYQQGSTNVLFVSFVVAILGAGFYWAMNRRLARFVKAKIGKNKGRELLIGKECFCISVGELVKHGTVDSKLLGNRILKEIAKEDVDYLIFKKEHIHSFYIFGDKLHVCTSNLTLEEFPFDFSEIEMKPSLIAVGARLDQDFKQEHPQTKEKWPLDHKLAATFIFVLIAAILIFNLFFKK